MAPLGLAPKEIAATLATLETEGFARPSRSLSPRDDCGPCPADTAAANKCLAQSNKSCAEDDATIGLDAAADLPPSAAAAFRGARLGLPRAPSISSHPRVNYLRSAGSRGCLKVIAIVDDDEFVREGAKALVESLGYEALTFSSAEDFLQSDHLHTASCLITDVQMPGQSGLDLLEHLTRQGFPPTGNRCECVHR